MCKALREMQRGLCALVTVASLLAVSSAFGGALQGGPGADAVAQQACASLQSKLGDKFASTFGSLDACVSKLLPIGQSALSACQSSGMPASDAFKSCMQGKVQAAVQERLGGSSGQSAKTVAQKICTSLRSKLGDKFASTFGSLDACESKLLPIGQSALSACQSSGKPASDAFKSCMQTKVQAAVKQQLGGGKSAS